MIPPPQGCTSLAFAQKAFILNARSLLMVQKAASDPEQPGRWEVPGGRLRLDETLDQHIRREVREEVGIEIVPREPFAMWEWTMAGREDNLGSFVKVVAVGRTCTAVTTSISDSNRTPDDFLGEAKWVPLSDAGAYDVIPSMRPALQVFLEMVAVGV